MTINLIKTADFNNSYYTKIILYNVELNRDYFINSNGQTVYYKIAAGQTEELNLKNLPKGFYIIRIFENSDIKVDRFVKL